MKTKSIAAWLTLMSLISILSLQAQSLEIMVTGRVTDGASKSPIAGVNVRVKNGKTGCLTNLNGEYSLLAEKNKVLVFSYIGFQTKEVAVTKNIIDVELSASYLTLQEVVTVGYGSSKKQFTKSKAVRNCVRFVPPVIKPDCQVSVSCCNVAAVDEVVNNEEYKAIPENRFKEVKSEPLSTFSLDVDAASYGNVRRVINAGQMPDKNSVRVEEFVNYFSYKYPNPKGDHPVNIMNEIHPCPWQKDHLLVRIGVKAKEIPSENLPASNFVFLLDVSGSMEAPNKLDLVKSSLKLLTNNLRDKDHVAIVVYAGSAGVVLPSTAGSDKQMIVDALESLQAGGSTAGGAGIQLAYKIAEKNLISGGNNRVILCTDGDFNVGVSSEGDLESLISEKRKSGVYLTVLGYGMGNYKDNKLQTLAEKGNGNHAYIDNIQEANKVLVSEFGSTMYAVAKDVKIQVEFNPAKVNAYRLVGYESRLLNKEDFNDDTKDAGELGAGHTVTAFYEVIPVGVKNTFGGVDNLKYQPSSRDSSPVSSKDELMNVKLRYKPIDSDRSLKLEVPIFAKDQMKPVSDDYQFASAVALFAQLLRKSDFKGDATYQKAIDLASGSLGEDKQGYRRELVRLMEAVKQMDK
ncbi:MAG: YfbK domain-containing protein [Bacteroidales bacterium]